MHLAQHPLLSAGTGLNPTRTGLPPITRVLFMRDAGRRGTITRMTLTVDTHRRAAVAAADFVRGLGFPPP